MLNTVSIGDVGETYAIFEFTRHNAIISKPLTNNARYDLIVEVNHRIYRVQVKTTNCIKDGKMEFSTASTNYVKGNWDKNIYSTNEVDLIFLYCVENNWCGLLLPEENMFPKSVSIRLEPPKNNQKVGIRLADAYNFNKQFEKLDAPVA